MTRWIRIMQAACVFSVAGGACASLILFCFDLGFITKRQVEFSLTTMAAAFMSAHVVWYWALRKTDEPPTPDKGAVLGVVSSVLAHPLMWILNVLVEDMGFGIRGIFFVVVASMASLFLFGGLTIPVGGVVGWAIARWQRRNWPSATVH